MAFEYTSAGLAIQTFAEALDEKQAEMRTRISARIATVANSFAGQIQRLIALYDQRAQERLQALHQSFDPRLAEGVYLDQRVAALGLTREPELRAEVLGTITTTGSATVPAGTRYSVGGFVFATLAEVERVGAGTITDVRVRSELYQPIDVSTLGAWSVVDAVVGVDGFDDVSQPIAGQEQETDSELRARADVERFARASGPLETIDAGVGLVTGVDFARAYHNVDPTTDPDANGIPYDAVNVIVDGGTDQDVAEAIERFGPAATRYVGAVPVTLGESARQRIVSFDRVEDVQIEVRVRIASSSSDEASEALGADDLFTAVEVVLEAYAASRWAIGKDVIPLELAAAIVAAGIPAIDDISIELREPAGLWQSSKYSITVRQRAVFAGLDDPVATT